MTKAFLIAVAATGLVLAMPASAQQKTNVAFAKGASAATFKGSIKGDMDHSYIVNARAGQVMTVDFKPSNASAYFNILAPGSTGEAMFIGSTSGNRFSGPLTVSGPHTIQVYLMRNAARRNETANYTLTVGVKGAAAAQPSRDALVAGTKYNATADVSCVTTPGGKPGACKAGVVRKGAGNAIVEMQTPDGGQRSITFTGGKATGSNAAGAKLTATKKDDITTVRLSTGEVYYIPDAFVFGG